MVKFKEWVSGGSSDRYAGYDRITGLICWLLIALISLYINLLTIDRDSTVLLGVSCIALFGYRSIANRFLPCGQFKETLDLSVLLSFVFSVCFLTGKTESPFVCVIYLILMVTSLTLGRRITSFMAAGSIAAYLGLALGEASFHGTSLTGRVVVLLPFMLTAHLAALLSGEAESAHAEMERLSLTDDLTDLNNMRSFHNLANQQEKLAKRYRKPYAICMLDSDNLKEINDRHGHLAGTELIKWTARIIGQNTRECDISARFGGDEFIIMYEGHDKEQIRPAVERIVRAMATTPFMFEGHQVRSTLSAGIASFPADGAELRGVIMKADEAMYRSKKQGKNMVSLSGEDGARKGRGALQVGGEQLGRAVPDLHRKTTSVHLGEGDLPGDGQNDGAALLEGPGKG